MITNSDTLLGAVVTVPIITFMLQQTWAMIRRRQSEDKVQDKNDRSIIQFIELLKEERDSLKKDVQTLVNKIQSSDAERISALIEVKNYSTQSEFLAKQVLELKLSVAKLTDLVAEYRSETELLKMQNTRLSSQVEYYSSLSKEIKTKPHTTSATKKKNTPIVNNSVDNAS